MNTFFPPVARLLDDLASARTTSTALIEAALAAIDDPGGEGARVFTEVYRTSALATAAATDAARAAGTVSGSLAGLPISIKDLFDVAGEPTRAGSRSRDDASPATEDAVVVARLRAAGAVIVGKTTMTEFAYSGLGLNPHDGTPRCAWDRGFDAGHGRAPGGSSSGAGVSVADGMAVAAIGTDTGGSVRIPAAFNGLVGFKPTARRVATDGCFPLSTTLDSIGPLAPTVRCCARIDAVLSGEAARPLAPIDLRGLRIGLLQDIVLDDLDDPVARTFERAVSALSVAGAILVPLRFDALALVDVVNGKGGFAGFEAWALHCERLATREADYDPRVASRIRRGASMTAADYREAIEARRRLIVAFDAAFAGFDVWIAPTVACAPPPLDALERDDRIYGDTNNRVLRNPSLVNLLDGCAITVPIHRHGDAPVGLMPFAPALHDHRVLSIAAAIEASIAPLR